MNSVSVIKSIILLIFLIFPLQGQRVTGCIRYDLLQDQSVRCAACLGIYGLTLKYTCELCSQSQTLTDGRCVSIKQQTTPTKTQSSDKDKISTSPQSSSAENNSLQSASGEKKDIPSNNEQVALNPGDLNGKGSFYSDLEGSGSFSNEGLYSSNPLSSEFDNVSENQLLSNPASSSSEEKTKLSKENQAKTKILPKNEFQGNCLQKNPQNECLICLLGYSIDKIGKCIKKVKDPVENCFVFSEMENICLRCQKQFELKSSGVCYSQADLQLQSIQIRKEKQLRQKNLNSIPSTIQKPEEVIKIEKVVKSEINFSEDLNNGQNKNSENSQKNSKEKQKSGTTQAPPPIFQDITDSENQKAQKNDGTNQFSFDSNFDPSFSSFGGEEFPNSEEIEVQPTNFQGLDQSFTSFGYNPKAQFESSTLQNKSEAEKQPIVHKYPEFPFCFQYEDGRCWACVPNYILNLIINKCVQAEIRKTAVVLEKYNSINDKKEQPISTTPDEFCNIYDVKKSECKECFRNYYFNQETKLCTMVDPLCRTFESIGGNCVSCYLSYHLDKMKCIHD